MRKIWLKRFFSFRMDEEWKERREKKMELSRIDMNQQDLLPSREKEKYAQ